MRFRRKEICLLHSLRYYVRHFLLRLFAFALTWIPGLALAQSQRIDPDEGTLSSIRPRIPEPMVFDLIRPLGAERGEFEINSLFRFMPANSPRRLQWAPEIEYAFLDGYGIEFEVPIENARIDSWKGAIQGTLAGPWKTKFIQGWQALGEKNRGGGNSRVDLLYLAGSRWHSNWSAFTMTGIERETGHRSRLCLYRQLYAFLPSSGYGQLRAGIEHQGARQLRPRTAIDAAGAIPEEPLKPPGRAGLAMVQRNKRAADRLAPFPGVLARLWRRTLTSETSTHPTPE